LPGNAGTYVVDVYPSVEVAPLSYVEVFRDTVNVWEFGSTNYGYLPAV
jgi:hypothetical protein